MQHIRLPNGMKPPATWSSDDEAEIQLQADRETLAGIVAGLDRLETLIDNTPVPAAAAQRGYFTPDEDDRVRQALLAYRNYRLASYEIICRQAGFQTIRDENLSSRCFLVGLSAALVLYAKSLKLIQFAEYRPLLRAKLNEPDAKYDLDAGFFDEVIVGYSSLSNYRSLVWAIHYWRRKRKSAAFRELDADPEWSWLCQIVRRYRKVVRRRLVDVLRKRLRQDWRSLWRTAFHPARKTRDNLQNLLGGRFAGVHVSGTSTQVITPEVLTTLHPQLQPGDILLCRTEGKLTSALLPGFWSHAAIYIGSRDELDRLDLRDHPHVARHWQQIPADDGPLGWVIEGVSPRVRISSLESSLEADHAIVLRPNIPADELSAALGEAFGHLGKPYDFEFDFNVSTRIVCTELVYRSYHKRASIEIPLVKRLGRFTLSADDLINLALAGADSSSPGTINRFQPVALILKLQDGRAHAIEPDKIHLSLQRIRDGWRPTRMAAEFTD